MDNSDDEMVDCPYNVNHRLQRKRLQMHLMKCKKNYPNVELQTCPYNKTHLVTELDYENHVSNCRDQSVFNNYKMLMEQKHNTEAAKSNANISDADWDEEVEDYNPLKYARTAALRKRPTFSADPNFQDFQPESDDDNKANGGHTHKPKTVGIYCFLNDKPDSPPSPHRRHSELSFSNRRNSSETPPPPPPRMSTFNSESNNPQKRRVRDNIEPYVPSRSMNMNGNSSSSDEKNSYSRNNRRQLGRQGKVFRGNKTPYRRYIETHGLQHRRDDQRSNIELYIPRHIRAQQRDYNKRFKRRF